MGQGQMSPYYFDTARDRVGWYSGHGRSGGSKKVIHGMKTGHGALRRGAKRRHGPSAEF